MLQERDIPEELKELFIDYMSAIDCRDQAIKSVFRKARAIYYGKEAIKASSKFWSGIKELYPDTSGKQVVYTYETGKISFDDGKKEKRDEI